MRMFFKCILSFICLFIISTSCVYAVDIDMDIPADNTNTVVDLDNNLSNNINNTYQNSSSVPKSSTVQTSEDFTLSVSDIINIILISVGIVLIFLAIAILIKIK